jgi:hypothetical protein
MEAVMRHALAQVLFIHLLAAMAVVLGGCDTSPPTKEQMESVDYGPKPDNYQEIVRDYLRNRLTDPNSALIDYKAGPTHLYQKDAVFRDVQFGWAVCVMVNDKNSYGAFTGFIPAVYFIRNGKVVAANGGPNDSPVGDEFARRQCKQLGYEVP